MTETGYPSHFVQREKVEANGAPVEYLQAWLAETAQSKEWKKHEAAARQLCLF